LLKPAFQIALQPETPRWEAAYRLARETESTTSSKIIPTTLPWDCEFRMVASGKIPSNGSGTLCYEEQERILPVIPSV
jgi:hypothetical protein